MIPSVTSAQSLLSADERAAIAEIEATTNILKLVTRLTGMRFAGIAKFTDLEWVVCSAYDPMQMGIHVDDVLFVPQISLDGRFAARPVVKQFAIESYAGAPIFLPDGRLFGALCALDSRAMLFDDPNLPETLSLFARLIGCIFYANLTPSEQ
jgi:GAF domain-containing protein